MQLVIRDEATLARVPIADVPVDFSRQMVLIVTLGRVVSEGYSVSIDRVWRQGWTLRVGLTVVAPPPNAGPGVATPFCVAVVPRCDLNVADFSPEPPQRARSWHQSPATTGW